MNKANMTNMFNKLATDDSREVGKRCSPHENMQEMKRVQRFIHVAVVTSCDRFLVSRASNHSTLEAVITKSKRFFREKIFDEKIVRTAKCVQVILLQCNFFSRDSHEICSWLSRESSLVSFTLFVFLHLFLDSLHIVYSSPFGKVLLVMKSSHVYESPVCATISSQMGDNLVTSVLQVYYK